MNRETRQATRLGASDMAPDDDVSSTLSPSKRALAEDRTDWAHRRTLLAKERTFAAWVRTGLSAIAVGLAAAQLMVDVEPRWLVGVASSILVIIGIAALAFGFWSYRQTLHELAEAGVHGIPSWVIGAFTLMLMVAAAAGLLLILLN